ncbi:MAG: glycosyltransferase [Propionibacteriaceae bacterium]|jgi:glycosyltransferase involved in cell wall biosynthesis|nr:glycosyltransferase [Propionibacteriaceae bacterium]
MSEPYTVLMSAYLKTTPQQLRAAIDSMTAQTVPPAQIVLVLDGPVRADLEQYVSELAQSKFLELLRLPRNVGTGMAKAAGIAHCTHEFIAHMDTDDVSLPDRCEAQLAAFAAEPELSAVGGLIQEIFTDGRKAAVRDVPETPHQIARYARWRNPFNHQSVMYRKSAVLAAGNYQHMLYFEDYWLWLRMLAAKQRFRNLKQVLVYVEADGVNERRGGYQYVRAIWRFLWAARNLGVMNWPQWLFNVVQRSLVAIAPQEIRARFYSLVLRNDAR